MLKNFSIDSKVKTTAGNTHLEGEDFDNKNVLTSGCLPISGIISISQLNENLNNMI
jgi:hypothetical protein